MSGGDQEAQVEDDQDGHGHGIPYTQVSKASFFCFGEIHAVGNVGCK